MLYALNELFEGTSMESQERSFYSAEFNPSLQEDTLLIVGL